MGSAFDTPDYEAAIASSRSLMFGSYLVALGIAAPLVALSVYFEMWWLLALVLWDWALIVLLVLLVPGVLLAALAFRQARVAARLASIEARADVLVAVGRVARRTRWTLALWIGLPPMLVVSAVIRTGFLGPILNDAGL